MLENVASDNKKIARRRVGESVWGGRVLVFKARQLYLFCFAGAVACKSMSKNMMLPV